ncbi:MULTISPECIES: hypothetical protein [Hyphomonas]|uniref:Uncharacterized protein n=1 Tax=Hyphomonas adhaerens TaxID=81029 RepID=A0A3B9GVG5_9PROT|nr:MULTISPECIES: hypothetical protein [Hyphomonas]MBB41556.1 hypothetical protein [Hyphomonas sp.]MCA8890431.1 hypothetical protein [Hyphomonas sp.]HAE26256.1 hypothetical protein [Hyphomonas adhaerens]|tara:strand:- start:171 stop:383 length:213 start_codon:yes stop_codon:yes gene_type:complete
MPVWFPFGFEQSRAAHQAAERLRHHFPTLSVVIHEGGIEIRGISTEDESRILRAAADALITCRNGLANAA